MKNKRSSSRLGFLKKLAVAAVLLPLSACEPMSLNRGGELATMADQTHLFGQMSNFPNAVEKIQECLLQANGGSGTHLQDLKNDNTGRWEVLRQAGVYNPIFVREYNENEAMRKEITKLDIYQLAFFAQLSTQHLVASVRKDENPVLVSQEVLDREETQSYTYAKGRMKGFLQDYDLEQLEYFLHMTLHRQKPATTMSVSH